MGLPEDHGHDRHAEVVDERGRERGEGEAHDGRGGEPEEAAAHGVGTELCGREARPLSVT